MLRATAESCREHRPHETAAARNAEICATALMRRPGTAAHATLHAIAMRKIRSRLSAEISVRAGGSDPAVLRQRPAASLLHPGCFKGAIVDERESFSVCDHQVTVIRCLLKSASGV